MGHILGSGGNAEVYAASDGEEEAALKVLKSKSRESEPFARFMREIDALGRIGVRPHVLPLLDAFVRYPREQTRAWLAMPIATPLREMTREASLPEVVRAFMAIAETLAELSSSLDLSHRDLKPNNLYLWRGEPAIGDFGLTEFAGVAELTGDAKLLGPLHFAAPEMLTDPRAADGRKADVFSLAKCLWVLATDQRWPPPGNQVRGNSGYAVGNFRSHINSHLLDDLIERCTKLLPDDRPTMASVAEELGAWLALEQSTEQPQRDLAELVLRLARVAAPELDEEARRDDLRRQFQTFLRHAEELFWPAIEPLRGFPKFERNAHEKLGETLTGPRRTWGSPKYVAEDYRCAVIRGLRHELPSLLIPRWTGVGDDGEVRVKFAVFVGRLNVAGGNHFAWDSPEVVAPIGSSQLELGLSNALSELSAQLPEALEHLVRSWDSK